MSMIVQHNMLSMFSKRQLGVTSSHKSKSQEKLSSGYKINRAADNAAGLAISEKMRKQIRGLDQGAENVQEGVGYCQTADGALNEVSDMLTRLKELSIQAANGTNSPSDRVAINDEVRQIKKEMNRIFDTTKYNETKIWDREKANISPVEETRMVMGRVTSALTPDEVSAIYREENHDYICRPNAARDISAQNK